MATEVLMPRQGQSVESCIIIEWKVKEGDEVLEGQPLCEVETDKATFEVEATTAGTVLSILYPADADVEVLKPIAIIGEQGEDISALLPADENVCETIDTGGSEAESSAEMVESVAPGIPSESTGYNEAASPRAKKLAAKQGVDLSGIAGTGPKGRVIERDVAAVPMAASAVQDDAVRMKNVVSEDMLQHAADFPGPVSELPVKGIRKIVADRMLASLQQTAQLTLDASADARSILNFRKNCKAASDDAALAAVTINDIVLHAAARTLAEFPDMNAHWLGEKIQLFKHVHLGFAVDTPRGLMVPVIRFADRLNLRQLSEEAGRLTQACLDGTIDPDALGGGTFTVTNLGALGIERFTPVLNAPEVGILGVCAIQLKPVMKEFTIEFIPHIGLSLTFDHSAIDGAPAARFLAALRNRLADFELTALT